MPKRLFIAILPSQGLIHHLKNTASSVVDINYRWALPHLWHITLIPPFSCEDPTPIFTKLNSLELPEAPLNLHLTSLSYGPSKKEKRLIWAKGKASPKLLTLHHSLLNLFNSDQNIQQKPSRFLLHLTLARLISKECKNPPSSFIKFIDCKDTAVSLCVLESTLLPWGSVYKKVFERFF